MAFENEASTLRRLAKKSDVIFVYRPHAEKAMKDDGLYKIDVENMLRRCSVVNVEDSEGEEAWRAYGSDGDGRKFFVIVVPYEEYPSIKVITVFIEKAKK
jgi:Domain of unknown function (DUF4258)